MAGDIKLIPMSAGTEFSTYNNMFLTFKYNGQESPSSFGYVISNKAFYTFIGSNQYEGTRLVEEEVNFPDFLMNGATRRALVHYVPGGEKFAAYVPVFPTEAEVEAYAKSKE